MPHGRGGEGHWHRPLVSPHAVIGRGFGLELGERVAAAGMPFEVCPAARHRKAADEEVLPRAGDGNVEQVRVFLMADAVGCAKAGQKVPEGYYNVQIMLGKVLRKGEVSLCGTCMDARGMADAECAEGAKRGTMAQLAEWTIQADKVLVF